MIIVFNQSFYRGDFVVQFEKNNVSVFKLLYFMAGDMLEKLRKSSLVFIAEFYGVSYMFLGLLICSFSISIARQIKRVCLLFEM